MNLMENMYIIGMYEVYGLCWWCESVDASKEVGLELNTEKTKYMLLSRHQNAGQNHYIKIGNRCFENVAQFRYLGVTITSQILIQEEIKGDWIRVVPAAIHSSTFCLSVFCLKHTN
jgi:hypothetical protein